MFWRKRAKAIRRTGVVHTAAGVATATVRRESTGAAVLESCHWQSVDEGLPAAQALEQLADASRLRRGRFSAVLANGSYQLLLIEPPEVPDSELRAAIRWKLPELVPFPITEAVIDVFDIPARSRRGAARSVYVVAAPNQAVVEHARLMERFRDRYDVLDLPEMCLRNVAALLPEYEQGLALIHVEDRFAHIVVMRGDAIYLARCSELASDDAGSAEAISLELQRSLDYFESHHDQRPVPRVFVSVVGSQELADSLVTQIGPRAAMLRLEDVLARDPEVDAAVVARNVIAIGAALRLDAEVPT